MSSSRFSSFIHLLLPWLVITIKGLEQGWLAKCQFNVTGWGIIFICGMVLPWLVITIKGLEQAGWPSVSLM